MAESYTLTGTQMGMLAFFGTVAGAHSLVWLTSWWRARKQAAVYTPVEDEDAPARQAATNLLKPTGVVDPANPSSFLQLTRNLLVLGAILFYVWSCEKNPYFPHGKRIEGPDYYWFMVFLFLVVALFTIKKSPASTVLSRDQTNEWKGWMQYFFIAYHYFHAMYVYKPVRVLVSTYVWMTGFGNFLLFDKRGDYGTVRFLTTMWRMNFATIFLLMTLNNTYVLYYIVPLHTMYFLVVYTSMRIRAALSARTWTTLVSCFAVTWMVWDIPGVFDAVFGWLDVFDGGVFVEHEWHFRTGLDQFSCLFGMLFAALLPQLSGWLEAWEGPGVNRWHAAVVKGVVTVGFVGAALAWAIPFGRLPKTDYNSAHPFFVLLPITAYIIVRNITPTLRSYYIGAFATLGTITLETYLLQHHIWLTSNAKTLLVLIPEYPLCNMLLTTCIFVAASKVLFEISGNLRVLVVAPTPSGALRNVGILLGALGVAAFVGTLAVNAGMGGFDVAALATLLGAALGLSVVKPALSAAAPPAPAPRPPQARKAASTAAVPSRPGSCGLSVSSGKMLLVSMAVLGASIGVCLSVAHGIVSSPAKAPVATGAAAMITPPADPLPRLTDMCADLLNDGGWQPLGGAKDTTPVDPLTVGLAEASPRVWKWSFSTTKKCGFGIKTAKNIVDDVAGRWVVFTGDSQARSVFRRLVEAASPGLTAAFGEPQLNGEPIADPASYAYVGHRDFELVWRQGDVATRLSFWWAPFVADVTAAVTGGGEFGDARGEQCAKTGTDQAVPDVLVASAASWDVLHNHDAAKLATDASAVKAALASFEAGKLCPGGADTTRAHVPVVVWLEQAAVVTPRLRTEEKRQYMTPEAIAAANKELTAHDVNEHAPPFTAVVDFYAVTESRGENTADGIHYSDSEYNVGFQLVANAAFGPATVMRCSTCKPTLTTVPGDPVLGIVAGFIGASVAVTFTMLRKFVVPGAVRSRNAAEES